MVIYLVFSNRKKENNHLQNKIKSNKQIINELCKLESKVLDFYDYKKTIEKMKSEEKRRKNEDN